MDTNCVALRYHEILVLYVCAYLCVCTCTCVCVCVCVCVCESLVKNKSKGRNRGLFSTYLSGRVNELSVELLPFEMNHFLKCCEE